MAVDHTDLDCTVLVHIAHNRHTAHKADCRVADCKGHSYSLVEADCKGCAYRKGCGIRVGKGFGCTLGEVGTIVSWMDVVVAVRSSFS